MSRIAAAFLLVSVLGVALCSCHGGGGGGSTELGTLIPGRTYGGADTDQAWAVQEAADGYVIAGFTNSKGAGGYDAWVVKTNQSGQVVQEKTFGGAGDDFAFGIEGTTDGGYVLVGVDAEVRGMTPGTGTWLPLDASGELTLRKLNPDLSLAWETKVSAVSSGTTAYPYCVGFAVQQSTDGGYIATGATGTGGGGGQTLLLKADANGIAQWYVFLPGELGTGVRQTADGGYVVSTSNAGLLKTTSSGLQVWNPTLLGSALGVCACANGEFVVVGEGAGMAGDVYVARIGSNGALLWERTFGSPGGDMGYAIHQTLDGGFILAGTGGSVNAPNHAFDLSLVRLNSFGTTLWERYFGGSGNEVGRAVRPTADGGYIVAGSITSIGAGSTDAYLMKMDASGAPQW